MTSRKLVRGSALPCLWLAAASLIYLNYRSERADPRPHEYYFAQDTARPAAVVLAVMLVEVVALTLVLRPWSYRRSWARALAALALLLPWTLVSMVVSMHAGSAVFLHWVWLFLLDCLLLACAAFSAGATLTCEAARESRRLKAAVRLRVRPGPPSARLLSIKIRARRLSRAFGGFEDVVTLIR